MDGKPILDLRKHTIKRIGGIGYVEIRIALIGKETKEIRFQRSISSTNAAVGILPAAFFVWRRTLFVQECLVLRMPQGKIGTKLFLGSMRQREHQCS